MEQDPVEDQQPPGRRTSLFKQLSVTYAEAVILPRNAIEWRSVGNIRNTPDEWAHFFGRLYPSINVPAHLYITLIASLGSLPPGVNLSGPSAFPDSIAISHTWSFLSSHWYFLSPRAVSHHIWFSCWQLILCLFDCLNVVLRHTPKPTELEDLPPGHKAV